MNPRTTKIAPRNSAPSPVTVVETFDFLGLVEKLPVRHTYQPVTVHMMHSSANSVRANGEVMGCKFMRANVEIQRLA